MSGIIVFGCKSTTEFFISSLKDIKIDMLVSISPEAGEKAEVADYKNLESFCDENGIKYYEAKSYNLKKDIDFFSSLSQENKKVGFCIGWQRLIPEEILKQFRTGVFGMHGSSMNLPKGRGRSPMNWSIIEGRKSFKTNLFKYEAGIDDGSILDSFTFTINGTDTGETLHFKNTLAMIELIKRNIENLIDNTAKYKKQKNSTPTYYPKRSPSDSLIDWQQNTETVERFIRAVAPPFNGAYSFINNKKITVLRASIFAEDAVTLFANPSKTEGEIAEVFPNGKFIVRCADGYLIIHEYIFDGKIEKSMHLNSGTEQIKKFPQNESGCFDMP